MFEHTRHAIATFSQLTVRLSWYNYYGKCGRIHWVTYKISNLDMQLLTRKIAFIFKAMQNLISFYKHWEFQQSTLNNYKNTPCKNRGLFEFLTKIAIHEFASISLALQ